MTSGASEECTINVIRLRGFQILPGLLVGAAIAGCGRAPTFNILGSFFPSWLVCMLVGIVLAALARGILVRFAFEKEILWPVVVYPCLALFIACALWLVLFS